MKPCRHAAHVPGCKRCEQAQRDPRRKWRWEGGVAPLIAATRTTAASGPGTELRVLLAALGMHASGCNCDKRVAQMNAWGPEGCRANRTGILEWLQESYASTPWYKKLAAGATAVVGGFPCTLEGLLNEAVRRSEKTEVRELQWAYGVTTVPSRRKTLLPRTLASLAAGGFPEPQLFVDGDADGASWKQEFNLAVTCREPPALAYGNWVLALLELHAKHANSHRFILFQDDVVCCKHLRTYLERVPYPEGGYCNLFTFPENQKSAPATAGWFRTTQRGLGGLALMFDRRTMQALFTHPKAVEHLFDRPYDTKRGFKALDGGVVSALNKAGVHEHCHNPSLVQHTGQKASTVGNAFHPLAPSFPGEDFDALELL